MTKAIYLDPETTAKHQPFEGDERSGFGISPFEVPRYIHITSDGPGMGYKSLEFEYPGGERAGMTIPHRGPGPLRFTLTLAKTSLKVLKITFESHVDDAGMGRIATAVRSLQDGIKGLRKATIFNYLMIASLLDVWPSIISGLFDDPDDETS